MTAVALAFEIADSTLAEDMGPKRINYASVGIRHYWVVDVQRRRVHCYADPDGVDYMSIKAIDFGDPLPVPGTSGTIVVS